MPHSPTLISGDCVAESLALLRLHKPLVHCMTNDVVPAFTANVLLALHAAPAMVTDVKETPAFAALVDALLVNTGTLTQQRIPAMLAAVTSARQAGTPWTLDPVAVGALALRTQFCHQLLSYHPAVIRGNASEILVMAQQPVSGRGTDSLHTSQIALPAAQQLAAQYQTLVVVTGEVDYVTDGERTLAVTGGTPLMTYVTGTGCALSAVVAAFTALPGDRLQHVASACRVMALAGEQASARAAGPGSFVPAFIDALWLLQVEAFQ